jgi:pimeloyl-ACP methyl ester carboxylesterase
MLTEKVPQDTYLTVNGLRLHYLDWGNAAAPPMLLLHGFSGHGHTWDTFAQAMCERFHVLALDQRGFGDSAWAPDHAYTERDHAADVRGLYDALQLAPMVLIGLSMGGRNAMAYTAQHPHTVARLVIVDIGPDIDPRGAERVRRVAAEAPEEFVSVDAVIDYLRQYQTHAAEAALRHRVIHGVKQLPNGKYTWKYDPFFRQQRRQGQPQRADLWPMMQQITVPTLIVRGSASDVFAPATAQRMQATIPDCQLVEIPGAGHSIPAEAPAAFEKVVREFLGT